MRTRGYFVAPEAGRAAPAVATFRKWLVAAGSLGETRISYLPLGKSFLTDDS
jgi:hypothetical protein